MLAEKIGRILDGEATALERTALRAQITQTATGEQLLRKMPRDNALLQKAVPAEVPQHSMDRFLAVIDREFATRQAPTIRQPQRSWTRTMLQLAAALVLIAGTVMLTSVIMQSRMDNAVASLAAHMEAERMLLAQTVQEALETKVSGEPVQIGQNGDWSEVLTPIKTYRSKSGHWCREYLRETSFDGMDMSVRGTACRAQNGTWTTVSAEPVADRILAHRPKT
ncbi:hypothetical protein QW131_23300 [Roseibium salinum]|nr:hypothetical protein [Roseibium salinum]